ncbi:hypothetical protein Saso_33280 [Streptomyces asoensis]|uniref:Uncharacterized protein n=1 Tax=Streptomyces asoensis TaxID=249586 RepID=A0ABQ3S0P4_9ACTN|nr:hypothetical protein GCM10010496_26620 [Streptomyces asoensis]GHI61678.1 hypothetical protein Saso_33280 [Streptomyces asoensis]
MNRPAPSGGRPADGGSVRLADGGVLYGPGGPSRRAGFPPGLAANGRGAPYVQVGGRGRIPADGGNLFRSGGH